MGCYPNPRTAGSAASTNMFIANANKVRFCASVMSWASVQGMTTGKASQCRTGRWTVFWDTRLSLLSRLPSMASNPTEYLQAVPEYIILLTTWAWHRALPCSPHPLYSYVGSGGDTCASNGPWCCSWLDGIKGLLRKCLRWSIPPLEQVRWPILILTEDLFCLNKEVAALFLADCLCLLLSPSAVQRLKSCFPEWCQDSYLNLSPHLILSH